MRLGRWDEKQRGKKKKKNKKPGTMPPPQRKPGVMKLLKGTFINESDN